MVKKSTIYTKTGDEGMTKLGDGDVITKNALPVNACGQIDELIASLGVAIAYLNEQQTENNLSEKLTRIQKELSMIDAEIAHSKNIEAISAHELQTLENEIDEMDALLPRLTTFILPGTNLISAYLHLARTICRRAEREITKLDYLQPLDFAYLNRLSDWLFVAARLMEKK